MFFNPFTGNYGDGKHWLTTLIKMIGFDDYWRYLDKKLGLHFFITCFISNCELRLHLLAQHEPPPTLPTLSSQSSSATSAQGFRCIVCFFLVYDVHMMCHYCCCCCCCCSTFLEACRTQRRSQHLSHFWHCMAASLTLTILPPGGGRMVSLIRTKPPRAGPS